MRQSLHAIDGQEGLTIKSFDSHAIRVLRADELTTVFVQAMGTGMITAC